MARRIQESKSSVKSRIIDAAWGLFSEKGFEATTLNDIIEAAGVAKGTFYYYFRGKDSLLTTLSVILDNYYAELDKELKENAHPWRQFWCEDAFKSQLAKGYGFNGIPRFIFIDKNGKLIAGDAPKPSSENIIEYIESKLALSDK